MLAVDPTHFPEEVAKSVLVVDDEVLIRLMMADALRDAGYSVIEAADAEEALSLIAAAVPVDLVVTDVRMPGPVDGLDLARTVRQLRPTLPIVVSSGHLEAREADVPGVVDAFLPKPYLPDQLLTLAERLIK